MHEQTTLLRCTHLVLDKIPFAMNNRTIGMDFYRKRFRMTYVLMCVLCALYKLYGAVYEGVAYLHIPYCRCCCYYNAIIAIIIISYSDFYLL